MTQGYDFEGPALRLGVLMENGEPRPDAPIRVPLRMFNRHGLVAGATGTGKTKTLQVMAEQLSEQGVPVFLADIKGDLSGMASPGESSEGLLKRTAGIGQDWSGVACPVEFYALGGMGEGVPLRATMTAFGPTLLAKVLELNETQESSLGLVFHFADTNGLPLLDMKDLRAVIQYLIDNPDVLKGVGGLSKQTAGVILRALTNLSAEGADQFFGEPEFDTHDLLRVTPDGRGVVSILELPSVQDRPVLFSTFLMWLLADLFGDLPEVGDPDKPRLVFFFDEAHLLFTDASKAFQRSITQTVRLIRSKGVGVFFVTQTPKDVPADVLAQLGARVQHALRAFTPQDAKALKATVSTFPHSSYDLEELLTQLGIGEAVVTVLSDKGVPTPVAWTRLQAPRSLMAPSDPSVVAGIVAASPLRSRYGQEIDRQSAYELLAARVAPPPAAPEPAPREPVPPAPAPEQPSVLESVLGSSIFKSFARSAASSLGREISRSIFGTAKRRRR
ncbi:helicase HerA-like domain-containing protein [Nonomuraea africana]|uniref:helicase HerA-like domain-containing protein n=1 Tax=Nonomuraea africana TaxID=46171 RepID=UPI0033E3CC6A